MPQHYVVKKSICIFVKENTLKTCLPFKAICMGFISGILGDIDIFRFDCSLSMFLENFFPKCQKKVSNPTEKNRKILQSEGMSCWWTDLLSDAKWLNV